MTSVKRSAVLAVFIFFLGMFAFTLTANAAETQKITTDKSNYTVLYGDSFNLNAQANTELTYKSSNEAVAIVNGEGQVTTLKTGYARIFIKAAKTDEYKPAQKIVTVTVKTGKITIQANYDAKGWQYLMGRKVTLWQKVNGKYTKLATREIGENDNAGITFENMPAGYYFWSETLQDDKAIKYINDDIYRTTALVSEKYGATKRLTRLHPFTYNKVNQIINARPNDGHILIKHDTSEYNVRLFEEDGTEVVFQTEDPPEWLEPGNDFEKGHWLTDLHPGHYMLMEEPKGEVSAQTENRTLEVEVLPGQVNYVY